MKTEIEITNRKQTADGFDMVPGVWQLPDNSGVDGNGNEYCEEQWTWGYITPAGSRYHSVSKGIWMSQAAAEKAMRDAQTIRFSALPIGAKFQRTGDFDDSPCVKVAAFAYSLDLTHPAPWEMARDDMRVIVL